MIARSSATPASASTPMKMPTRGRRRRAPDRRVQGADAQGGGDGRSRAVPVAGRGARGGGRLRDGGDRGRRARSWRAATSRSASWSPRPSGEAGAGRGRRHGAARSSTPGARAASARATSSARSPTRRTCRGSAIGAIDIYDHFTFVEVPAEYRDRILERMVNVEIRNRPVHVKLASPSVHGDAGAGRRPQAWGREAVPEGRQAALQGARRESAAQGQGKRVGTTARATVAHSRTSGRSYPVTVTRSPPNGLRRSFAVRRSEASSYNRQRGHLACTTPGIGSQFPFLERSIRRHCRWTAARNIMRVAGRGRSSHPRPRSEPS